MISWIQIRRHITPLRTPFHSKIAATRLFKESNKYFCKIENFADGEINKQGFSNPQPGRQDSRL